MTKNYSITLLEQFEGIAVAKLPVPGFELLPLQQKLFLYHMCHAAIAGDSLTYLQQSRYGYELTQFFLTILKHEDIIKKHSHNLYVAIIHYTKKLCINHGNHDFWSGVKFIPSFTRTELFEVIALIKTQAARLEEVGYLEAYDAIIFDPHFEPQMTCKTPNTATEDIISASCNTFYDGVTLNDLEGFKDQNPNNSTVSKQYGHIVEKIWRAGNDTATPGMYAKELSRLVTHLRAALPYADPVQVKSLKLLIQYFEEGTAKLWDDYNIAWLHTNPVADLILGFVEEYRDARGVKGLYEGLIYYRDEHVSAMMHKLAHVAQTLELRAPWDDQFKNMHVKPPIANAVVQLIGTGGAGPYGWVGVNLPNAQWIRAKHGSKNIIITNALLTSRSAMIDSVINEFIEGKTHQELLLGPLHQRELLKVGLHEIVGHGAGIASPELTSDPSTYLREHYSTLEEARAELCMLWHAWDQTLFDEGIITDNRIPESIYLWYAFRDLLNLRKFVGETQIHECHDQATHLIVSYLREKGVIEFYTGINGKIYPRIVDFKKMREYVGVLLSEIQRIKSTGDYAAGRLLVETYGTYFDFDLCDEIVARAKSIHYFSSICYVMPIPEIVTNDLGEIIDVILSYPEGIIEQARLWTHLSL